MFKRVLAIAVIGAAALTSVGACASDYGSSGAWSTSRPGYRYAPPPVVRYAHPPRYVAPRYYPPYRWAPSYRWAPPYAYYRHGYHPGYRHYWNGHRWSDHGDHHGDHDNRDDDRRDRHR